MQTTHHPHTQPGTLPEDWEVRTLRSVSNMKSGETITANHIGSFDLIPCYGGNGLRGFTYRFTHDGEYALIGRQGALCGNVQFVKGKFFASEHAIVVDAKSGVDIEWLYFVLVKMELNQYAESSAQPGLSVQKILALSIPIPPTLHEQQAIAQALSDADALIRAQEKLIAKKRLIKQGAMQQLLQPKDGWERKRLRNHSLIYSGGTPSTSVEDYYKGDIPWIISGDLNQRRVKHVEGRISKSGLENSAAKMILPKTLLIALYGATAGVSAISEIEGAINQAVLAINTDHTIDTEFLFNLMQLKKRWIIDTFTQGGQPNLSGDIIKSLEFEFPTKSEQTRIAAILSDIDAEIAALEKQRHQYRQLKQGMMQQLLTGKVRLV